MTEREFEIVRAWASTIDDTGLMREEDLARLRALIAAEPPAPAYSLAVGAPDGDCQRVCFLLGGRMAGGWTEGHGPGCKADYLPAGRYELHGDEWVMRPPGGERVVIPASRAPLVGPLSYSCAGGGGLIR